MRIIDEIELAFECWPQPSQIVVYDISTDCTSNMAVAFVRSTKPKTDFVFSSDFINELANNALSCYSDGYKKESIDIAMSRKKLRQSASYYIAGHPLLSNKLKNEYNRRPTSTCFMLNADKWIEDVLQLQKSESENKISKENVKLVIKLLIKKYWSHFDKSSKA